MQIIDKQRITNMSSQITYQFYNFSSYNEVKFSFEDKIQKNKVFINRGIRIGFIPLYAILIHNKR